MDSPRCQVLAELMSLLEAVLLLEAGPFFTRNQQICDPLAVFVGDAWHHLLFYPLSVQV